MATPKLRGFTFNNLRVQIEKLGPKAYDEFLATLTPAQRKAVAKKVGKMDKIDGEIAMHAYDYLFLHAANSDIQKLRELGAEFAAGDAGKVLGMLLKLVSPAKILKLAGKGFSQFWDQGSFDLVSDDGSRMLMRLSQFPIATDAFAEIMAGGLVVYLEKARCKSAEIERVERIPGKGLDIYLRYEM